LTWCFENQNDDGSWNNFEHVYPKYPYSSMAQGEGCSLLIRGFIETGDVRYLNAAKKAIDFMLIPKSSGGTAEYNGEDIIFYEFTCFPYVFNGWIFSIFGLMDYVILTKDHKYLDILNKTINTLKNKSNEIDLGYWSRYRNDYMIASSFYHNLHIAQYKVLYEYTNIDEFKKIVLKFKSYRKNPFIRFFAFWKKAFQKIAEK
jgi:hypothetical protein